MQALEPWVVIFIFQIFVSTIIIIIGISLLLKYRERKIQATLMIALTFILFGIAPLLDPIDPFFFNSTEVKLGEGLAYMTAGFAMVFLTFFNWQIFRPNNKSTPKIFAIFWIILASLIGISGFLVTFFYTSNPLGEFYNSESYNFFRGIYDLLLLPQVFGSYLLFSIIINYSIGAANESTSLANKRGFQLIAMFSIGMMIIFLFLMLDVLVFGDYSFCLYIAWGTAGVSSILAYLGYTMPPWLKKRWEN